MARERDLSLGAKVSLTMRDHVDERKPWQRQPREPAVWHARFKEWLRQKKPRSFLAICNQERERRGQKGTDSPARNWRAAFEKYRWRERADTWDKAEQERLDRQLAEKRERQREKELAAAEKLYDKADDLMELPITKQVEETDDGDVILLPDHKSFKTAADLYAEARANARAALEMTDKRQTVDLKKLSTDELIHPLASLAD